MHILGEDMYLPFIIQMWPSLSDDHGAIGTTNLNQWYLAGDQAYIIIASAMVMVMIPGLGFLYSGLARRKSALSMILACSAQFLKRRETFFDHADERVSDVLLCNHFPVVFLGLFFGLRSLEQWLHWKAIQVWSYAYSWSTFVR